MKKIISFLIISILIFSLAGCKKEDTSTKVSVVDYYRNFCTQAGEAITDSADKYLSENSSIFTSDKYDRSKYVSNAFHFDEYYDNPTEYRSGLAELRDLKVISCHQAEGENAGILFELTDGNNGYAVFMFGEYDSLSEGDSVSLVALPLCASSQEVLVLFAGVAFM